QGACETCAGVGETSDVDPAKLIGDPTLSLREGVILPWGEKGSVAYALALAEAHQVFKLDVDAPWSALPERDRSLLLFGAKKSAAAKETDPPKKTKVPKKAADHPGLLLWVRARLEELAEPKRTNDDDGKEERVQEDGARTREELRGFLSFATCRDCGGARLRREARAVKLAGKNLPELAHEPLEELLLHWKDSYDLLRPAQRAIAKTAWESVFARLRYLCEVGLGYLSLDRTTDTLSTGEGQRIRLASQLGAGLVGVLYVLDEPGTGLHPKDHEALLRSEKELRDLGNTVVVIDHSRVSIRNADWIVEFGPGAGIHGGEVITEGTLSDILSDPKSLSSRFLKVPPTPGPPKPLPAKQQFLTVEGVTRHNLKDVSARFPLGKRTTVVGVSGSGKSTMVLETLLPAGRNATSFTKYEVRCKRVLGLEHIGRVCVVDQEPIGRTARSNPATYSGMFGDLRELFASTPDARARGYKASRFSFNVKGGRCEVCFGEGIRRIEMQFMADVEVGCDACQGARYNRETLDVRYAGRSIADVLRMSVDDVYAAFENIPLIRAKAAAMRNVGLGYLRLGQPAGSLSGGEAQRLRLARELAKKTEGKTLYIFDEPTSGLHFLDVEVLLRTFDELRDRGNTLVVIEHNLDVIASSDWIVELGPGAGKYGGKLVFEGTPGDLLACKESPTAPFLRP
nr:excinuclease ABC subunit UvrA [Polyangiaceae bacterium]